MSLDDARDWWQAQEDAPSRRISEDALLRAVKADAATFDRTIRARDWRETIVAILVFILFLPSLLSSCALAQVGAALVLAGCVMTVARLERTRRRHRTPDPGEPLVEVIRAERDKVSAQIGLLSSVLWWAILPILSGVVLVAGCGAWGSVWIQAYVVAVGLLGWLIWWANQRAIRRELQPLHDQLTHALAEVERPDPPIDGLGDPDTGSGSDRQR